MHASFADGGLSGKFAFFLFLPDQSGTAAGHYTRDTIVDAYQLRAITTIVLEMTALILSAGILYFSFCLFYHNMTYTNQKINLG
jgi:hypothetical protein